MQNYTLKIQENNDKALALLNYLKTLDFIEISETKDWWDELNTESKNAIDKGLKDIETRNTHTDKNVRESIHERIINASNK